MTAFTIDLEQADTFTIEGRVVRLNSGDHEQQVRIPTGARVTIWRRPRATLHVGGLRSINCTVHGRLTDIERLWRELTDTSPTQ